MLTGFLIDHGTDREGCALNITIELDSLVPRTCPGTCCWLRARGWYRQVPLLTSCASTRPAHPPGATGSALHHGYR